MRFFLEKLDSDLDLFYQGLDGIPTFAETGGVTAIGETAFPVAAGRSTPFIAAARYGDGRVVAAGHESCFDIAAAGDGARESLTRNVTAWLTQDSGPVFGGKIAILLPASREARASSSFEPVRLASWAAERPDPRRYPLALLDESLSESDVPFAEAYIKSGGAVIVAAKGWELEEKLSPAGRPIPLNEYPLQKLLNKAGLGLLGNVAVWSAADPLPKLSAERAMHAHALFLLDKAKSVEAGALSIEDIPIGPLEANAKQKTEAVMAVLSRTIESLTDASPLYRRIQEDERSLPDVPLPLDRSAMPHTGALLVRRFKRASLAPDGGKSPYADLFPGRVADGADILRNVPVRVDFGYDDLGYLRTLYAPGTWQSTGLYAPPGQTIEFDVPDGTDDLDVQIGSHTDTLFHLSKWDRAPLIALRTKLAPGTNRLGSPYGGLVYFIPTRPKPGTVATITVSGAVQAPYYVAGQTSDEAWNRTLRGAPAPVAELRGARIILTLPSDCVRELENPRRLMADWDAMVDQFDRLIGVAPDNPLPHRSPNRPHRIVADRQISAGYMHAGYPIMIPIEPAGRDATDFAKVRDVKSGWGFWHELGHNYQQVPWFWGLIVEVTVNLHSLHMQDRYGNRSRLFTADKEGRTHYDNALEFVNSEKPGKHFGDIGFFERLVMLRQLQLKYGMDFYTRLHVAYRELPEEELPRTDGQKLDRLVVMMSRVSGDNLLTFFDKWGWPYTEEARAEVAALRLPEPDADFWTWKEPGE
ncbi:M60 family metallopeptidase [Paenibacillus sp. GYB003]|uniref:M60 family metallopeptidase n=1 Tax=Paenibacillus sp. GYB003 TaxID=2994392 RepID=UPI002F96C1E0